MPGALFKMRHLLQQQLLIGAANIKRLTGAHNYLAAFAADIFFEMF